MLVYRCVNFYLELNFKVLVFFKICSKCGRINIEFIDIFLINDIFCWNRCIIRISRF